MACPYFVMQDKMLIPIGNFFYRFRSFLPIPFYLLILYFGHTTRTGLIWGSILIGIGLSLRLWASGYAGKETRLNRFSANRLITCGPYGFSRHPLYIGNFFLTLGVLILYSALPILVLIIILLFLFEYYSIIVAEEDFLVKNIGPRYEEYRKRVPILFKFKIGKANPTPTEQEFSLANLAKEINTIFLIVIAYFLIVFKRSLINLLK